MAQEVSKVTVMVLLILTILVSVVGTWSVLSGLDGSQYTVVGKDLIPQQGDVQFAIQEPTEPTPQRVVLPQSVKGEVGIQIV